MSVTTASGTAADSRNKTVTVVVLSLLVLLASLVSAVALRVWVLTALPIGFLFGFFLQKGDLCGASAFSEVLLFRDGRKLLGIWICVVVSMLAFALGDLLGLVNLNPKPMFWQLYVIGGLVFGIGTVLAGGCISGCLYKGATGNLNSIVALLAMPAGIALVEYGPLNPVFVDLKSRAVAGPGGGALDLRGVTGLPFWVLALGFALATAAVLLWRTRRRTASPAVERARSEGGPMQRLVFRAWKPWQAGLAIGLLALPAYISSAASGRNYPLGVTHGVLQAQVLVTEAGVNHIYKASPATTPSSVATAPASAPSGKKVVWWLVLVVAGTVGGAFTAGRLSGNARLLPKPPEQLLVAIPGGFLVGAGAAFATGCIVGNIMSGWALMSVGMLLFGAAAIAGNWVTTWLYLMGGAAVRHG